MDLETILGDVVSPTDFAGLMFGAYKRKRSEEARRLLRDELKNAKLYKITEDQAAASMLGLYRAYEEGTALQNLRLIAQAFDKAATEPDFETNEFRRHTSNLASLTTEEIEFVGRYRRLDLELRKTNGLAPTDRAFMWEKFVAAMKASKMFPTVVHLMSHASALQRTGWFVPSVQHGEAIFVSTPSFEVIGRLVDWQSAMRSPESGKAAV